MNAVAPPAPAGAGAADLERQYLHSRSGPLAADRSDLGRLSIAGRDALDLLHRLTTQDLKALQPWQGAAAVFVTAKGRILDRVLAGRLPDRIVVITGPGRAGAVKEWIERYTFREEVSVEDRTTTDGTLGVYGPGAAGVVADLFGRPAAEAPLHHPRQAERDGAPVILSRTDPLAGEGFLVTLERPRLSALRQAILESGRGALAAGAACLELLRIEAGQPATGRELSEEFNPWEAGLRDAISLSKGCYVGQEVIARLNTYQKVSKRLVRIGWEGDRVPEDRAGIEVEAQPAGTLTSAARLPAARRIVALGFVQHDLATVGRTIDIVWDRERAGARIEEGPR